MRMSNMPDFPDLELYSEVDGNEKIAVGDILVGLVPQSQIVEYRLLIDNSEFPENITVGDCREYGIFKVLRRD